MKQMPRIPLSEFKKIPAQHRKLGAVGAPPSGGTDSPCGARAAEPKPFLDYQVETGVQNQRGGVGEGWPHCHL